MQDGRREAIHNPPQGKATQGGEQHGYQPSERRTNPTTRANGKKGEKKGRRDKRRPGRTQKPLMFCFSTGTGLDEIPFIEPCISSSARQQVFVLHMLSCVSSHVLKSPNEVGGRF